MLNFPTSLVDHEHNRTSFRNRQKDEIARLLDQNMNKLFENYGTSLNVQFGQQVDLGVFMDYPDALGFSSLTQYQMSTTGKKSAFVIAWQHFFRTVKQRLLYFYVYSSYEDADDLEWVRNVAANWAKDILAANANYVTLATISHQSGNNSHFDWDSVVEKGVVGAVVGGILALMAAVCQSLRQLTGGGRIARPKIGPEPRGSGPNVYDQGNTGVAEIPAQATAEAHALKGERAGLINPAGASHAGVTSTKPDVLARNG